MRHLDHVNLAESMILHELEELGQTRPEQLSEILIVAARTGLRALGTALIWGTIITGGRWLFGDDVAWWSALITYGAAFVIRFGVSIESDLDEHVDGLRSQKTATSYAPSATQSEPVTPASPIIVRPYGGEPYVLDPNKERPALPDGRTAQLGLNPETLAVILREVLSKHDGQWSRSRLMAIRIGGQRITRTLYEQMTDALCKAGFLQERPIGGYAIPPTIQTFDDLRAFFPYLPGISQDSGREGRKVGGREGGPSQVSRFTSGEMTAAERHRLAKFQELDHNVQCYLKGESHV